MSMWRPTGNANNVVVDRHALVDYFPVITVNSFSLVSVLSLRRPPLLLALSLAAWLPASLVAAASDTLQINGELTPATAYRLQVDYKTTVNRAECQFDDYITGMRIPLSDTRYFTPRIDGSRHQLDAALNDADSATAATQDCGWQPKVISICLGLQVSENAVHCLPLFIVGHGEAAPSNLKLVCDRDQWVCSDGNNVSILRREVSVFDRPLRLDITVREQP